MVEGRSARRGIESLTVLASLKRRANGWMLMGIVVAAITLLPKIPYPWLVYNPSESVPVGFYWITPADHARLGDLVLMQTPPRVVELADQRRYLPRHVPMLKYVAALSGDQVCASGEMLSINGRPVARRLVEDHMRRAMPWWNGCKVLGPDDMFVLNPLAPLSFDGRYFGVVSIRFIRGKAKPL
jgi:conjugative transfer signal peptidase TraF